MRRVGLALLGFAGGAVAGVIATLTAIWLWFDVLGMTGPGRPPMPALDWLVVLGPLLTLGSGIALAWWTLRRDRAGKSVTLQTLIGAVGVAILGFVGANLLS